jgi:hypothetical protein
MSFATNDPGPFVLTPATSPQRQVHAPSGARWFGEARDGRLRDHEAKHPGHGTDVCSLAKLRGYASTRSNQA